MEDEVRKINQRLTDMQKEIDSLRQGHLAVNRRYVAALESLKQLTIHAREAAQRAADASTKAALAARNAAMAGLSGWWKPRAVIVASPLRAMATRTGSSQ